MHRTQLSIRKHQRGVVAIVSLIFIFVLFGLTGLAIDIGNVQSRRTLEQTAADAAATAAAMEIAAGRPTTAVAAGKAAASLNGFADGTSNIAVSVVASGSTASATITQAVPLYFMPVVGISTMNIAATATGTASAGGGGSTAQGSGCVYALSTSANPGLNMNTGTISANCDVVVNSTAQNASIRWSGGGPGNGSCVVTTNLMFNGVMNLYPGTSPSTQTSWTYNQNNQWYQQGACSNRYGSYDTFYQVPGGGTPVATMMTSSVNDPLSALDQTALESQTACNTLTSVSKNGVSIDYNSAPNLLSSHAGSLAFSGSGGNGGSQSGSNGMMVTLNPGVYCGGLTLGSQTNFTLNPGVYSIRGGTLTINSQAYVQGSGVMFYLSTPVTNVTSYSQNAHVTISGQPLFKISGGDGTNSTVKDVAIWVNRNSAMGTDSFNGASTSYLNGSLYAPTDYVQITGNGSANGVNLTLGAVQYGSCYGSTYLISDHLDVDGKAALAVSKTANQCPSGSGSATLTN